MIDYGFAADQAALIDDYFGMMIIVVAVLAVASAVRYYLVMSLGERVMADVRSAVFGHLTKLDPGFYDTVKSGEIVSRLTADTTQIKSAFGASASVALRNLVLFLGAATMMVVTSPRLSGLVLLVLPLIVLPLVASGRSVRRRSRLAQDRLADASAFATEAIGATRVMQAFNAERPTVAAFAAAAEEAFRASRTALMARSVLTAVAIFLIFASVVAVLWYGAQDVLADRMTAGRLSQFVLYAVFAAGALGQLSEVWGEVSSAAGAAGRIAEILAIEPRIKAPLHPRPLPSPPQGTVAFEDVTFAYPTAPDLPVLHGLSFSVARGERVAIVGPSGAGKSTIVQLLLRFYDPSSGRVVVDGVPLTEVDPRNCAAGSPSCRRIRSCSARASPRTSATAARKRARRSSARRLRRRRQTNSSQPCRTATTRNSASGASRFPAGSASASPSPAPSCATRRSFSSTRRPRRSTQRARRSSRRPSIGSWRGARPSSSRTGWRPC